MQLERRAEIHAALGDPVRLAIVDELSTSDRSPSELSTTLRIRPPHLAFHLDTLERAGLVRRVASSGDRRRRYVQLDGEALAKIAMPEPVPVGPVVFVCTHNSARSQLAAVLWRRARHGDATSAGTHPADRVHPGAIAAARRVGIELGETSPRLLDPATPVRQIITVCDQAHEELRLSTRHWSIPDPVEDGSDAAFDRALNLLRARIAALAPPPATVDPQPPKVTTVALPPTTVTLPPTTVTLPPTTVTLPPTTVTLPPTTVTLPPTTRPPAPHDITEHP